MQLRVSNESHHFKQPNFHHGESEKTEEGEVEKYEKKKQFMKLRDIGEYIKTPYCNNQTVSIPSWHALQTNQLSHFFRSSNLIG
jgi:hypothetical protein